MRPLRNPERAQLRPTCGACCASEVRSGDDVRRQLVFDERDAVAQIELALLEALHLQQVGGGRILQGGNRNVEVSMLLKEPGQLLSQLALLLWTHRRAAPLAAAAGPLPRRADYPDFAALFQAATRAVRLSAHHTAACAPHNRQEFVLKPDLG